MLFLQWYMLPGIATAATVIHMPARTRMHYNRLAIQVHPHGKTQPLTPTSSHHASTPRKRRTHEPSQQLPQNGTNTPKPQA
ncbi:hypothetical protein FKM82_030942 [Ascaphus truei]